MRMGRDGGKEVAKNRILEKKAGLSFPLTAPGSLVLNDKWKFRRSTSEAVRKLTIHIIPILERQGKNDQEALHRASSSFSSSKLTSLNYKIKS